MVVDGDCMAPDYLSGEIVTFSPLEVQRYGVGRLQPDPKNLEPLAALVPSPVSA